MNHSGVIPRLVRGDAGEGSTSGQEGKRHDNDERGPADPVRTVADVPDSQAYITDSFLQDVAADDKLRAFATEFDPK